MGLHTQTVSDLARVFPRAFVERGSWRAEVVVVDATERFMYAQSGVGGSVPQTPYDMWREVESFVEERVRQCSAGLPQVVVVLVDDARRVPREKGVAHARRYAKGAPPVAAEAMGRCAGLLADVSGREHALPWSAVSEAGRAKPSSGWREIVGQRSIRQRLAEFATRQLTERSTLGMPAGSRLVVCGPRVGDAAPEVAVVELAAGAGLGLVRRVDRLEGVVSGAAGGEADVRTAQVLRWLMGARGLLGLASTGEVSAVLASKDSDMMAVCAQLAGVAGLRVYWMRQVYERTERVYRKTFVEATAMGAEVARRAGVASADPQEHLANWCFALALCGCDFTRRVKGVRLADLLRLAWSERPLRVSSGGAGWRLGADWDACERVVKEAWALGTGVSRAVLRPRSLGAAYEAVGASRGGKRFRVNKEDVRLVAASVRAACWVAHYWVSAGRGAGASAAFAAQACWSRSRAGSAGFGFAVGKSGRLELAGEAALPAAVPAVGYDWLAAEGGASGEEGRRAIKRTRSQ